MGEAGVEVDCCRNSWVNSQGTGPAGQARPHLGWLTSPSMAQCPDTCDVTHLSIVHRRQAAAQFQRNPRIRVALLSLLAAGVGLDFSAASAVAFAGVLVLRRPGALFKVGVWLGTAPDSASVLLLPCQFRRAPRRGGYPLAGRGSSASPGPLLARQHLLPVRGVGENRGEKASYRYHDCLDGPRKRRCHRTTRRHSSCMATQVCAGLQRRAAVAAPAPQPCTGECSARRRGADHAPSRCWDRGPCMGWRSTAAHPGPLPCKH